MCDVEHLEITERVGNRRNHIPNFVVLSLLLGLACVTAVTTACSAALQSAPVDHSTIPTTTMSLSPATATVGSTQELQFIARRIGNSKAPLTWSASAGTISSTGMFTAPRVTSTTRVTITATSSANRTGSEFGIESSAKAVAEVIVTPPAGTSSNLTITNSALPVASVGAAYTASLSAVGGVAPYLWSLVSGSLPAGIQLQSSAGTIVGTPTTPGSFALSVQVTDAAGHNATAGFSLTVTASSPALAITNTSLPAADATVPYTASISATGGEAPYRWSLASGSLPSGIQLQSLSGVLSGVTTAVGSFPFSLQVTDASGHIASAAFNLTVSSISTAGFDGPAELPRSYIQSAMSNSPAPGKTTTVNAGGDLQSALNNASCGDTIQLQAGATFPGIFTFPAKNCDESNWIIVRTSSDDSLLPAEGTRLTPCYGGIASLPGRPALQCASTRNVLAKLVMPASASGPVIFAAGANYYRLIGLELTRGTFAGPVYNLVMFKGAADHVIFDRMWLHGLPQSETARGIGLEGTNVAIVDSFFTDFHCVSGTGSCSDAQALAGGGGNLPMGPYKITNNFLEGSTENIIFGGGAATMTPADIEIRQNHFFKPLTWLQGQANYVGGFNGNPFTVKNLLELKNAQRVLVEGNILDYTWGGFSQSGFAILLTPKNQAAGSGGNLCPICQVTDVTIRYNLIRHVGAGFQIANALSDNGGAQLDGERYSIHDIVIDDMDGKKYKGASMFAQLSVSAGAPILQNVTIDHVTAFPSSMLLNIGSMVTTSGPMKNFVFTNNVLSVGAYPVWSTGGGPENCAYSDKPLATFNSCFSPYTFAGNLLIGNTAAYPASAWPRQNFFSPTASEVQFVSFNGGSGGNYSLRSSSPFKGRGTDGRDVGADMNGVASATASAE